MLPKLIRLRRFADERGWFAESFNSDRMAAAGICDTFVQDNHSFSLHRGTVRGLHFQTLPHAQAKLVRCTAGVIWDVAVDLRSGSPTFGRWVGARLSADGGEQLYIPVGFAHGFVTLADNVEVQYKASSHYSPDSEGSIVWNDPALSIDWPIEDMTPILSKKDAAAKGLAEMTANFPYTGIPVGPLEEVDL